MLTVRDCRRRRPDDVDVIIIRRFVGRHRQTVRRGTVVPSRS